MGSFLVIFCITYSEYRSISLLFAVRPGIRITLQLLVMFAVADLTLDQFQIEIVHEPDVLAVFRTPLPVLSSTLIALRLLRDILHYRYGARFSGHGV